MIEKGIKINYESDGLERIYASSEPLADMLNKLYSRDGIVIKSVSLFEQKKHKNGKYSTKEQFI